MRRDCLGWDGSAPESGCSLAVAELVAGAPLRPERAGREGTMRERDAINEEFGAVRAERPRADAQRLRPVRLNDMLCVSAMLDALCDVLMRVSLGPGELFAVWRMLTTCSCRYDDGTKGRVAEIRLSFRQMWGKSCVDDARAIAIDDAEKFTRVQTQVNCT